MLVRISFGLSLALVGIVHLKDISNFTTLVGQGLGPLEPIGKIYGYAIPILMIVGGVLFAIGMYAEVAVWAAGIALASLPVGLMLKSAMTTSVGLDQTMPYAVNAFVWILVMMKVSKGPWRHSCKDSAANCAGACGPDCGCGKPEMKS